MTGMPPDPSVAPDAAAPVPTPPEQPASTGWAAATQPPPAPGPVAGLAYASVPPRFIAFLIDVVLYLIAAVGFSFLLGIVLVVAGASRDPNDPVWNTVSFSRGLFGKPRNPAHIEKTLKALSLWDKKDNKIITLSGGMKRRLMIAKALSHEPQLLFLDEPTAGVDVNLRRDMWQLVRELRDAGVTVILTTHYIEEAEEMADRIGVINKGELILVEDKAELMRKLGRKQLTLQLTAALPQVPPALAAYDLALSADGCDLTYHYDARLGRGGIATLLEELSDLGIAFKDLHTTESSLEDIFVSLVREQR